MEKILEEKLNSIGNSLEEVKRDVGANKNSLEEMKRDVGANKANILVGFKEVREELTVIKARIDETYNAVDGFTKIVARLEDEFIMIKEDLKRVKAVIKEKLGVDLE